MAANVVNHALDVVAVGQRAGAAAQALLVARCHGGVEFEDRKSVV